MEKLIFALWAPADVELPVLHDALRRQAAPALEALGCQRLKMALADIPSPPDDPYEAMKRGAPSAYVSFWLNSAYFWRHADAVLAQFVDRRAGFAVAESVILPNTRVAPSGQPNPGALQVAAFASLPDLSRPQFLRNWLEDHTAVAVETQSTTSYTQNIITRALTAGAPAWEAIVEECFPKAALTDRHIYFASGGKADVLARHEARMAESCQRFIDFSTLRLIMASEYRFGAWADPAFGFHQDRAKNKGRIS